MKADSPPITSSCRPALDPLFRLQWEVAQDAWVLLYPEGMVQLNQSAAEILRRCDGRRQIDDIVAELQALFGRNPVEAWRLRLQEVLGQLGVGSAQLIHGFFKDLVDTWNAMVDAWLDTTAILLPPASAFPKHLLLGSLRDPTALRTAFFPSVADSGAREAAERAGFLARKLDAQLRLFILPADTVLRVTPSMGEGVALEERAIPWYYQPDISRYWNFRLSRRQQAETNLGYRAGEYGGSARARQPLAGAIAGYEMFRVEGHLGREWRRCATSSRLWSPAATCRSRSMRCWRTSSGSSSASGR